MPVIAVDATHLGGASTFRGIGTYLRGLLGRLAAEPDLDVRALTTDPAALPAGVTAVPVRRRAPGRFARREHDLLLPRDLRRTGADVVWSPAQDPPRRSVAPVVQTLHDVTPLAWPHPELEADAAHLRRMAPRLRAASAWIANSAYTADSCSAILGIPRDRIAVAHLGVGDGFAPAPDRPGRPGARDDPYVLYVGEYGAHKGFAEAFAVAAALADAGHPHRLRMVGRLAPWWRPRVEALLAASPRPDRVDLVGFADDLAAEYQGAAALLCTSRHEGFGFPVVEAMACATPVVAFANSSLVEVVAGGGTLVPDGDVAAAAEAVAALLDDEAAWEAASARAHARSAAFSWDRCAGEHARVLRAVAAG